MPNSNVVLLTISALLGLGHPKRIDPLGDWITSPDGLWESQPAVKNALLGDSMAFGGGRYGIEDNGEAIVLHFTASCADIVNSMSNLPSTDLLSEAYATADKRVHEAE